MKARLLFASLTELVSRTVSYDKSLKIIHNGDENDYSERVDRLIENSITAKQCRKLFRQFCTGKGFGEKLNETTKNKKGTSLFEFLVQFTNEFATQNGVYVHVMYNLEGKPCSYTVVPFTSMRRGEKDSTEYSGKFAEYHDWIKPNKGKIKWTYAFNARPEVVKEQIKEAKKVEHYTGQTFFFNPSNTDYPLSHVHPVMNDADSEFRGSVFKNKSLRKGFFGKNIIVTPPRVDPSLSRVPLQSLSDDDRLMLKHQTDQSDSITKTLQSFVGVENNEGFMSLEMEFEGDNIEKAIKHIKIDTDIDDKLFAYTEESAANNIRKSYNNVPLILVEAKDKSIFGKSGEAIVQAKLFYQEQTDEERRLITQCFKKLFQNFDEIDTDNLVLEPLIAVPDTKPAEDIEPIIEEENAD